MFGSPETLHLRLKISAVSALAGAVLILVMAAFGAEAGSALTALEQPVTSEGSGSLVRAHAEALIRVLALDNIFLIAYTGAFIGAAALIWRGARLLAAAGLGFAILTALLDLVENAFLIHLARTALFYDPQPFTLDPSINLAVSAIGQVKYAGAGAALVFFAAGLLVVQPAGPRLRYTAALLFLLFPFINAIALVQPGLGLGRVVWMFLMLICSAFLLWQSAGSDPTAEQP